MDWDFKHELITAGQEAARARAAANKADAARDYAIRQASYHGGMTVREISAAVGISHQRVAQIINNDPIGPKPTLLHDAISIVMKDFGEDWVPVHEIARLITERGLYRRRDGHPLPPSQVRARAAKYPELFEGSTDGTNRIRLRRAA